MPSDVIWAALIGGFAGGLPTYLIARGGQRLERLRITAESERLREQHRDVERRDRKTTYLALLTALRRIDVYAVQWGEHERALPLAELHSALAAVSISASDEVWVATEAVFALFRHTTSDEGVSDEGFVSVYMANRVAILDARRRLSAAMREDVARPLLPSPPRRD